MYISVAEAQGQLLDLVRRAEAGEEVLITHEGRTVARLEPSAPEPKPWAEMRPEERKQALNEIVAKMPPKPKDWPGAARSQDFLYDDDGLPA